MSIVETRPTTAEELFVLLMEGMVDSRESLGITKTPTQDEMAAVWAWAKRAANSEDLERDLLENVMEGQMWVDWQDGSIVFRITPKGEAHVEALAAGYGGDVEALMRSMGMDPDGARKELQKRGES